MSFLTLSSNNLPLSSLTLLQIVDDSKDIPGDEAGLRPLLQPISLLLRTGDRNASKVDLFARTRPGDFVTCLPYLHYIGIDRVVFRSSDFSYAHQTIFFLRSFCLVKTYLDELLKDSADVFFQPPLSPLSTSISRGVAPRVKRDQRMKIKHLMIYPFN